MRPKHLVIVAVALAIGLAAVATATLRAQIGPRTVVIGDGVCTYPEKESCDALHFGECVVSTDCRSDPTTPPVIPPADPNNGRCPDDPDGNNPTTRTVLEGRADECLEGVPNMVDERACRTEGAFTMLMFCPDGYSCKIHDGINDGFCSPDGTLPEHGSCGADGEFDIFENDNDDTCNTHPGYEDWVNETYCPAASNSWNQTINVQCPEPFTCRDGACVRG